MKFNGKEVKIGLLSDTAVNRLSSDRMNDKYSVFIDQLFYTLDKVGKTATFEVDNAHSFKTAFYKRKKHKANSVIEANKSYTIRFASNNQPIKSTDNQESEIVVVLVEDRNKLIRKNYHDIPLTEQFPGMTEEQIHAMLNRKED